MTEQERVPMTEEPAIRILKRISEDTFGRKKEALDLVVSALKKQVPKKPRVKTFDFTGQPGVKPNTVIRKYICPNCRYVYGELMLGSYCGACGQKIDWTKGKI